MTATRLNIKEINTTTNHWTIKRELGSGEMGRVFLGCGEDGKEIAIKLLNKTLTARQKDRIERFKLEFRVLKELNHPGINNVHDFGMDEKTGLYFFTSEYIKGQPFLNAAQDAGADKIEDMFVQILRALEYLHSHGIMHGDIKSANVLVRSSAGKSQEAKLIDFGLAILGLPHRIVGTPSYMAPEIILKERFDNRADLYSLGVLIYTAFAKSNPFLAKTAQETFERQLNLKPEKLAQLQIPEYLDNVLQRLLKKSPAERFKTAADVIHAINFGGGGPYQIETRETFLGYLASGGTLIGREKEFEEIKKQCLDVRDGNPGARFFLCIEGEAGTGRKGLLEKLKNFAQLNEIETAGLFAADPESVSKFEKEIGELSGNVPGASLVICNHLGILAVRKNAAHVIWLIRKLIRQIKVTAELPGVKKNPLVVLAFEAAPDEMPFLFYLLELEKEETNIVKLENFSVEETGKYLAVFTGVKDVPQVLVSELHKMSRGNPLFMSELIKEMAKTGMLFDSSGRWKRETMEDIGIHFEKLKIPGTIKEALKSAYENALPDEKGVLEAMAVWMRPARIDELETVVSLPNLRKTLVSMIDSGMVIFSGMENTYSAAEPLLNDVVYEKMQEEKKFRMHEKITAYLERTRPDAFEEINRHIGKGGNQARAVDALLELGGRFIARHRPMDAITAFTDASGRSEKSGYRLPEILLHLGEANVIARQYRDAITAYKRLIEWQKGKGRPHDLIVTCQKLGLAHMRNGELGKAKEIFEQVEDLQKKGEYGPILPLKTKNLIARLAFLEGKFEEAAKIYRETKDACKKFSDDKKMEAGTNDLAHVYLQMGRLDEAEMEFTADIAYFEKINEEEELKRAYYATAELCREKNRLDRAVEYFEKAIGIAKKTNDLEMLLRAYNGLGNLYSARYEEKESLYWYERGLDIATRTGEEMLSAAILVNIGRIKSGMGNHEEALEYLNCAAGIISRAKKAAPMDIGFLLRAHIELAGIHRIRHDFSKADFHIAEAKKLAASSNTFVDQIPWIEKTEREITKDRGEAEEKTHDEISIMDIGLKDDRQAGGDMSLKHYRYILEINKYLGGETDPDFVIKTILKYAIELSGAESGLVLLSGKENGLTIRASSNVEVDKNLSEMSSSIAKKAIEGDEIISTQNALNDERFRAEESVMILQLKSVMCVPIHARKEVIGVIYLENRRRVDAFGLADKEVLGAFADQAGIAIENARLLAGYEETDKKMRKELEKSYHELERLDEEVKSRTSELKKRYQFDKIVSISPLMKNVFDVLSKISDTMLSACIMGESGTGKELVARAVHYSSIRGGKPFVAVNCGAIPAALIESELFGYKAGAFTGAIKDKMGLFEAASGGTMFLDEIADLDIALQAKLLRVIQEREFMRVGDTKTVRCDVRILCATNKNLEKLVEENKFRKDLYYRVAEIKVELPPLRRRIEDIPILIDEFISEYCAEHKIKNRYRPDAEFIRACASYEWPGNIRELENAVRVATAMAEEGRISLAALPENHFLKKFAGRKSGFSINTSGMADKGEKILLDGVNIYDVEKSWRKYEALIIAAVYKSCGFDAKKTAGNLKIAQATVYKKIAEFGLKDKASPLFESQFTYRPNTPLDEYITQIFRAAWEYAGKKPYKAARLLGVSHGYFYKVMKRFKVAQV